MKYIYDLKLNFFFIYIFKITKFFYNMFTNFYIILFIIHFLRQIILMNQASNSYDKNFNYLLI